jgi:porin
VALATKILKHAPILAAALLATGAAWADEPADLFERERLGGELGGLRPYLDARGFKLGIDYSGETLGVVSGGVRRGFVYEGLLDVQLDADLDKAIGWPGGAAHVEALEVHGRGPSADLLGGNLMDVSNIEARQKLRLFTLWLEQSLLDDRLAVRAGQLAVDSEFAISDTAANLLNGTFGWPIVHSANMTGAGPAYPTASPGVRLRGNPAPEVTVLAALFRGNPGGTGCVDDPQLCNPHGTDFSLGGGALWIGELQYAAKLGGSALPGSYKLGGWRETGSFADQRTGASHDGNYGIYAIADQMVWRRAGTEHEGLNLFLRVGAVPDERNLVSWYIDGGFGFTGLFAGRPDDVLTLGVAYGRISGEAADADRDAGPPTPVRDHEAVIELSYAVAIAPWWTLHPDVQYVIHPGGNVLGPDGSDRVRNAWVLGARSSIAF